MDRGRVERYWHMGMSYLKSLSTQLFKYRIISRKTILRRNPAARRCCHYVFYQGEVATHKANKFWPICQNKPGMQCQLWTWMPSLTKLAPPCLALPRPAWGQTSIDPIGGLPRLAEGCNIDPTGSDLPCPRPAWKPAEQKEQVRDIWSRKPHQSVTRQ